MPGFADLWPPVAERLQAVEDRYRANRVRARPEWPPSPDERLSIREDLLAVVDLYLGATAEERATVRHFFRATDYLVGAPLQEVANELTECFQRTGEPDWMERALAVCSMEDQRVDFRDTYQWLGSLYLLAVRRGIEPGPLFRRAAELSAVEERDGLSTHRLLAEFESSAFFAEAVAPHL